MLNNNFVIIVGGGSGTRMQSTTPKQFLDLCGQPILMHTIQAFATCQSKPIVVVALNHSFKAQWLELCNQHLFDTSHIVVNAGQTRFHSVLNALTYIKENFLNLDHTYIAVHDGVRPLIDQAIIDSGYREVITHQALATAITSKDSVRIRQKDTYKSVDRDNVFLIQTPQFFSANIIINAYRQPYNKLFTDDASVVEKAGYPIQLINGDTRNIKITFAQDLIFAEALIKSSNFKLKR
ncbi:2-C-methyl-D-erythritol 4-phosphate cytidylyltransferase [Olivibacter sp. SDN3]|uniref:2-C-methyl-D-erythritol 4-phosphate cytidylyltransferase n=1 Tax=Olivibacter sp. SDN3 TaxID=2764720 RepID=UPI0016516FDF|nr:2-C-methyl-D-erythritol 4-phosphate cytidylyltransferase [Olivibacter sp. SDN3]QNL49509.1 2-C-methyl-D-erythritol 4-phosphate cytidylyltransferase [Olivibacter sp. SDN3]